jgi:hypothetical protein
MGFNSSKLHRRPGIGFPWFPALWKELPVNKERQLSRHFSPSQTFLTKSLDCQTSQSKPSFIFIKIFIFREEASKFLTVFKILRFSYLLSRFCLNGLFKNTWKNHSFTENENSILESGWYWKIILKFIWIRKDIYALLRTSTQLISKIN